MRYSSALLVGSALVLGFCLALTGCAGAAEPPPAAPIAVTVSYPVEREVTDYADFTARIAAVDSVEVRAHVWGYLEKVNFKEGALVKKGDVLFELDPRPYQAMLNQAKAKVAQAKAQLTRTTRRSHRRNLSLDCHPGGVAVRPGQDRGSPERRYRQRGGRQGGGGVAPAGPGVLRRSRRRSAGASAATSSRWAT